MGRGGSQSLVTYTLALLVGAGFRLWQYRRERLEIRALEEKYGVREDAK